MNINPSIGEIRENVDDAMKTMRLQTVAQGKSDGLWHIKSAPGRVYCGRFAGRMRKYLQPAEIVIDPCICSKCLTKWTVARAVKRLT